MNESLKVQHHHLERGAYLYIRQSSMRQVLENIESTKRQYALRARATALGWPDEVCFIIVEHIGRNPHRHHLAHPHGAAAIQTRHGAWRPSHRRGREVLRVSGF